MIKLVLILSFSRNKRRPDVYDLVETRLDRFLARQGVSILSYEVVEVE